MHHAAVLVRFGGLGLEKIGRHHRRQQPRHQQGGEHRNHGGPAELLEHQARNAAHHGGGQEHGHQSHGGGRHGQGDFRDSILRGLSDRFAQMAVAFDVLDLDDRVIHQNAHDHGQRQQGDRVERIAQPGHRCEGGQDGQGQGGGGNERGPPVPQEEPDNEDGQDRAFEQHRHRPFVLLQGLLHRAGNGRHFQAGVALLKGRQGGLNFLRNGDFVKTPGAIDIEADRRLAIEKGGLGAFGRAVHDGGHLVQPEHPAVRQGDSQRGKFLRLAYRGDGAQRLFLATELAPAAGRLLLNLAQCAGDIAGGNAQRRHAGRIHFDQHFALHTANALETADACDAQHRLRDDVVDKPRECFLVHARGRNGEGQDRGADAGGRTHGGLHEFCRQIGPDAVHGILGFNQRVGQVLFQHELHPDRYSTIGDRGVQMVEPAQRGQGIFDLARHFGFQLRRGRPGLGQAHRDHRHVEVRQVLRGQVLESPDAGQREQHEQQNRGDGIADGPGGEIHG